MYDQTLFRDPEVFEFDYVPEYIHHRDAEMRELAYLARPGMRGGSPRNAVIRGLPGTGKTTTVLRLFAEIEETTKRLVPVYVNCQHNRTKFTVFARIFEKLAGHMPPPSGMPLSDLMRKTAELMQTRGCVLLVCLDDANYLHYEADLNNLLYNLLRLHETYAGIRTGVYAIVSDMSLDLCNEVDSRVFSVFHPTEVTFLPYSKEGTREILAGRVRQGLFPNVMPGTALDLITDLTYQEGDVRAGIEIIRLATENAERDARRSVTRGDVMAATRHAVSPTLQSKVTHLKEGERELLHHIADLKATGEHEMTSGAVFGAVCEDIGIGYTTFYGRLRRFEAGGFLDLPLRTRKGRTREIVFRYDPEKVVEACRQVPEHLPKR